MNLFKAVNLFFQSRVFEALERNNVKLAASKLLKLKFITKLLITLFILNSIVFFLSTFHQIFTVALEHFNWPLATILFLISIFYFSYVLLLVKGYYRIVTRSMLYFLSALIWAVIFFAPKTGLHQPNILIYVFLIIATGPILIVERKSTLVIVTLVNISIAAFYSLSSFGLNAPVYEFIINIAVPMFFLGLVSYYNFSINQKALDKANADVKAKAEIEVCLAASERKYREMTELLPQTIFEADLKGNISYVNIHGLKQFGYNNADVGRGVNVIETIHSKDREKAMLNMQNVLLGKETNGTDYLAIRKDGTTFPINIYTAPIIENGITVGMRGVIIDISERVKAEQEKIESDERFGAMLEFLPYAVNVTDMDGRFLIVNNAFCKEYNCTKEQAYGKTLAELGFSIDENTLKLAEELIQKNGIAENIEATVTKRDNSVGYSYFSSKVVRLNQKNVILSSSISITEKKLTEQELDLYRKNLEILVKERTGELAEANNELGAINEEMKSINEELSIKNDIIKKQNDEMQLALHHLKETQSQLIQSEKMASLGVLTSGVAHEINNPLNFIVGAHFMLEEYLRSSGQIDNPEIVTILESIKTGADRVTKIVSSLNEFSRGNTSLDEICDIHTIVDNCLVMLNSSVLHRIEIQRDYQTQGMLLKGNSGKLHQVFINVLNNAIQSIPEKGTVTVRTFTDQHYANIEIGDTGIGIASEILHRIMDPFFTTKDPGKGTGLGLSITYNILKEINGDIKFVSEPGKGTIVTIMFKLA